MSGLVRALESMGESEVESATIGKMVMESLAEIDQVAYVRFASVYKNFHEVKDFAEFIGSMPGDEAEDGPAGQDPESAG